MNFLFSFAFLAFVCQISFAFTLPGNKKEILSNLTKTSEEVQDDYKNFRLFCEGYFEKISEYSKTQDLLIAELENEKNDKMKNSLGKNNEKEISTNCVVIARKEFEKINNNFSHYLQNECPSVYKIWNGIKLIRKYYDEILDQNIRQSFELFNSLYDDCAKMDDPSKNMECANAGIPMANLCKMEITVYTRAMTKKLRVYNAEIEPCLAGIRSKRTEELRNASAMISECINRI